MIWFDLIWFDPDFAAHDLIWFDAGKISVIWFEVSFLVIWFCPPLLDSVEIGDVALPATTNNETQDHNIRP